MTFTDFSKKLKKGASIAEEDEWGYKRFIMKISDRIYRIDRINSTGEFCNRFSKSLAGDKLCEVVIRLP